MRQRKTNDELLLNSRLLFDELEIDAAITKIAKKISQDFSGEFGLDQISESKPDSIVALCVMNGAIPFFSQLLLKLPITLELDYIHASRYNNSLSGSQVQWLARPTLSLVDKTVIIVDDILDEGITLREIGNYCIEAGAREVKTAILLEKQHGRNLTGIVADYLGLLVPDEYVVGFGMDCEGIGRNLPTIHALNNNQAVNSK
ncbi:hypoxanthine-guanine phosphoribosyltransferase [Aurantivibrio infirmus]